MAVMKAYKSRCIAFIGIFIYLKHGPPYSNISTLVQFVNAIKQSNCIRLAYYSL
jgi:hypothetical protein